MTRTTTIRLVAAVVLCLLTCGITSVKVYGNSPRSLAHIDTAQSYVGTTERGGNNNGPEVRAFLRSVGLGPGYPWCAAFVSYCLTAAGVEYPTKRTAGARAFISDRSVTATDVLYGRATVKPGWLVIWRRGNSWAGHIGIVTTWGKASGATIEGNTSSGRSGSQRDGDGVWSRTRSIQPGNYFRITHFEPVEGRVVKRFNIRDFEGGAGPAVPPVNSGGWAR